MSPTALLAHVLPQIIDPAVESFLLEKRDQFLTSKRRRNTLSVFPATDRRPAHTNRPGELLLRNVPKPTSQLSQQFGTSSLFYQCRFHMLYQMTLYLPCHSSSNCTSRGEAHTPEPTSRRRQRTRQVPCHAVANSRRGPPRGNPKLTIQNAPPSAACSYSHSPLSFVKGTIA